MIAVFRDADRSDAARKTGSATLGDGTVAKACDRFDEAAAPSLADADYCACLSMVFHFLSKRALGKRMRFPN
ncbi:MAG: hypothetical protein AAGC92_10550 [Pseudomonadota bacterium]